CRAGSGVSPARGPGRGGPALGRCGGRGRDRERAVHGRLRRPGPPDPDLRRTAHQQFPSLATRLYRALPFARALARFPAGAPLCRDRGVPEAGAAFRARVNGLRTMPKSELGQRVAVAAIGIPVAIAAIVAGGWYLGVLLAAVALGSALELFRLAERSGIRPMKVPGAAFAAGSVLVAVWQPSIEEAALPLFVSAVVLVLLAAGAVVWVRGVDGRPLP